MKRIDYNVGGSVRRTHDAAILTGEVDLAEAVAESVMGTIALDVEVELGGVKVSLAALLDPDHWDGSWSAVGVDDVDEFLAGLVSEQ